MIISQDKKRYNFVSEIFTLFALRSTLYALRSSLSSQPQPQLKGLSLKGEAKGSLCAGLLLLPSPTGGRIGTTPDAIIRDIELSIFNSTCSGVIYFFFFMGNDFTISEYFIRQQLLILQFYFLS
jgi:hypothetical protein